MSTRDQAPEPVHCWQYPGETRGYEFDFTDEIDDADVTAHTLEKETLRGDQALTLTALDETNGKITALATIPDAARYADLFHLECTLTLNDGRVLIQIKTIEVSPKIA